MPRLQLAATFAAMTTVVLAMPPAAFGQSTSAVIVWEAPAADCPDEAYVRAAVAQLLGGDAPTAVHVEARARVGHAAADQWQVHLSILRDGTTGERVVESTSCRSLADATALIVALTIDPQRVAANRPGPPPPASPASASASAPAPAPAPAPASPAPPPPRSPLSPPFPPSRAAVFASLSGDLGTLPGTAYGVSLGAALLFGPYRLEAYGTYWPAQTAHASLSSASGGDVSLVDGGLRGCWAPLRGAFELAVCPGLELGDLHGQGKGVRTPLPADGVWVAVTALGRAAWRLTPTLALSLDAGLAVPFVRDQFKLDATTIHQAKSVEARASFGPELRF